VLPERARRPLRHADRPALATGTSDATLDAIAEYDLSGDLPRQNVHGAGGRRGARTAASDWMRTIVLNGHS
jgi:hypothetical protein